MKRGKLGKPGFLRVEKKTFKKKVERERERERKREIEEVYTCIPICDMII